MDPTVTDTKIFLKDGMNVLVCVFSMLKMNVLGYQSQNPKISGDTFLN